MMSSAPSHRLVMITCIAILVLVAMLLPFSGQSILGFQYGVFVDNLAEVCPSRIVSTDGKVVLLDDGRRVMLEELDPAWLLTEIEREQGNGRVRFDSDPSGRGEGMLYMPRRIPVSGTDRPENRQLLTIPLVKKVFPKYAAVQAGAARELTPRLGPAAPNPTTHVSAVSRNAATLPSLITTEEAVVRAKAAIGDRLKLPSDDLIDIQLRERHYVVTWRLPPVAGTVARGDYAAKVTVDAASGEVVEVLAGS